MLEAFTALVVGFLFLAFMYTAFFLTLNPEFDSFSGRGSSAISFPGRSFKPVISGGGYVDGDAGVVTAFEQGQAVLTLRTNFRAENYPFVAIKVSGLTVWADAVIFWKKANEPDTFHQLALTKVADGVSQIALAKATDKYRGTITEIGIAFAENAVAQGNGGKAIRISSLELVPFSLAAVTTQLIVDWLHPPLLKGRSNNIVTGSHDNSLLLPGAAINLLLGTSITLAAIVFFFCGLRGSTLLARLLSVAMCLCLYAWILNDTQRWAWRYLQASDTHQRYAGLSLEQRIRLNTVRCRRQDDCFENLRPYF